MAKNLVIVESPAKAKTIEKYLGKEFTVLSSIGHIRSIAKKPKSGAPPIDIKNGFETTYEVDAEKKKVITELKKAVKQADTVWLATDEDREGEAIAWHLCEVLGLDLKTTKRIVFHEITKEAINDAIAKPRTVDMHLVEAQQARQILDRIVGFELSPVVWQKVPGGKSAGRVQSPAVRLLAEREAEINKFTPTESFKINANFSHDGETFSAEASERPKTEAKAKTYLEQLAGGAFTVDTVSTQPGTRNPSAPFTTSTLQQEANSKLSFSSKATMSAAQRLYQSGKITYMRTDSVNLSKQAIAAAASFVEHTYGKDYVQVRTFQTKSKGAQEAHEAIRPTDISTLVASDDPYDQKLYELIRKRTLASQMSPAKIEKTTIGITQKPGTAVFETKGEVIVFDGFLKAYGTRKEDDILPAVSQGDTLTLVSAQAKQLFSKAPARFSEGSLVKKLEELGIGRPSTYATIIATVQARGYAVKGEGEGTDRDVIVLKYADSAVQKEVITEKFGSDKGKLVPTPSGMLIASFLSNHFEPIVDYGFTASVEEHFDDIADNKLDRNHMLEEFYKPFHELITQSGTIERSSVAQAREVGTDPKSGKPILARFGRFGPLLQLGDSEEKGDEKSEKPVFAPMPKGATLETVTLEQALRAFELPRLLGQTEDGQDMKANIGRFGPYVQVGKLFVSIKPLDPHEITHEQALEMYAAKLVSEAEKNIADFGDGIKVLKGRYGPYVTDGKKNAKIDKSVEPSSITHEEAKKMIAAAPAAGKNPGRRKFAPRKKK
ncbi:MAG: type I DNA topoisomerase [Candidatus Saccharimonadales bacterium]